MALPPQRRPTPAWGLGLFEAEGTVEVYPSGGSFTLTLQLPSTTPELPEALHRLFGGRCYGPYRRTSRGKPARDQWLWELAAEGPQLEGLLARWSHCPSAGPKGARLPLVPVFLGLRAAKAHQPDSPHRKAWATFYRRWRELRGASAREQPGDPPRRRLWPRNLPLPPPPKRRRRFEP